MLNRPERSNDDLLEEAHALPGRRRGTARSPSPTQGGGRHLDGGRLEQGLRFETAAIRATLASEDYQAGLAAFAEKRSPNSPPDNVRSPRSREGSMKLPNQDSNLD